MLRILDQNGAVRLLTPQQVTPRRENKNFAVASDAQGNDMKVGDAMKETEGEVSRIGLLFMTVTDSVIATPRRSHQHLPISVHLPLQSGHAGEQWCLRRKSSRSHLCHAQIRHE